MGTLHFQPPQNQCPLTDRQKFVTDDYAHDFYSCAKFGKNPSIRDAGQIGEKQQFFFIYAFLSNSPTGQTICRIFTFHGSNDAE